MAYDFFTQPTGPAVNVSLFGDAGLQGAKLGEATPSAFSSAVEGAFKGVERTQQIVARDQAAQINQNTIERLPVTNALQDEQLKQQQLQTEAMIYNQQAAKATQLLNAQIAADTAKARALELENKITDLQNTKDIGNALAMQNPESIARILTSPQYAGTFLRDSELGLKVVSAAESLQLPPDIVNPFKQSVSAVAREKALEESRKKAAQFEAENAAKEEESFRDAYNKMLTVEGLGVELTRATRDPNGGLFNANSLRVVSANSVTVDPNNGRYVVSADGKTPKIEIDDASKDKGAYLLNGTQIVRRVDETEVADWQKAVGAFQSGAVRKGIFQSVPQPVQQAPAPVTSVDSFGAPAPSAAPTPAPTAGAVTGNQRIIEAAKQRREAAFKQAQQNGIATNFLDLEAQGRQRAMQAASSVNYAATPQTVPTPATMPKITQAAPTPQATATPVPEVTKQAGEERLSAVMGGATVQLNSSVEKLSVPSDFVQRVNAIPEIANKPAILKGLITVESGGNPNAVSPAGAAGLTQLMPGTAADMGLSDQDRFDPIKNVQAGEQYYNWLDKSISRYFAQQGLSIKPDPRVILAAYNGGIRYVRDAIAAGNVTWDDIKDYLGRVKSPEAAAENLAYPDKVILASLPFIKGGNASDDAYVTSLINYGIISPSLDV